MEKTKLGEGGFGTVSVAHDKATGVRSAVKLILKAHVQDVDLLRKEIEITQKMDHPNIVRLFAEKYLTEPIVKKVMKQVFGSIAYCHSKDVVHRDLKPENYILLSKTKQVDQTPVKLIDFGLATRCRDEEQMKTAVGTSYYVAPEVLGQMPGEAVLSWVENARGGGRLELRSAHAPPAATELRLRLDVLAGDEAEGVSLSEAIELLEQVVHQHSGAGSDEALRGARLLVVLQSHRKFPEGARTARLEEAVLGLKSNDAEAEQKALQVQDEVVSALADAVDIAVLGAAVESVAITANPKSADIKARPCRRAA
eukprot:g31054.t1